MKLYIATILKHDEYFVSHERTFVEKTSEDLANKVYDYLSEDVEEDEENPFDPASILVECTNGNEGGEPLSMGLDTDLRNEFLLATKVVEI